jgi:hypothetical protein
MEPAGVGPAGARPPFDLGGEKATGPGLFGSKSPPSRYNENHHKSITRKGGPKFMTKDQMVYVASYRLFMHWVKLYYPQKVIDWKPVKTSEEATDERVAHFRLLQYLKGPPNTGSRLFNLIQVLDIRETRQLCLGEPVPKDLAEEASLLFAEAEELLAKKEAFLSKERKNSPASAGGNITPFQI